MKLYHTIRYVSHIIILAGFVLFPFLIQAQARHEISINGGGGLSSLYFGNTATLDYQPGLGGVGGLNYTFFFSPQIGIGTGAEVALYQSKLLQKNLSGATEAQDDPYNPGYFYQVGYRYQNFEEQLQDVQLQIPLFVQFQTYGEHKFYVTAGGRVGYHLNSKYKITADRADISGIFDFEGQEYADGRHGFGTYNAFQKEDKLQLRQPAWMVSVEAGMKWKIGSGVALYTGVYADYCLNNLKNTNTALMDYHFEGPDYITYHSVINTDKIESVRSVAAGIKIRLAFDAGRTSGNRSKRMDYDTNWQNADQSDYEIGLAARQAAERAASRYLAQNPSAAAEGLDVLTAPLHRFGMSKVLLSDAMKSELDRKIRIMKANPELVIEITGYTCNVGSESANRRVGLDRANAAKNYMVEQGIAAYRISTASKGTANPVASNETENGRQLNRRLEFTIIE